MKAASQLGIRKQSEEQDSISSPFDDGGEALSRITERYRFLALSLSHSLSACHAV